LVLNFHFYPLLSTFRKSGAKNTLENPLLENPLLENPLLSSFRKSGAKKYFRKSGAKNTL